MKKFLLIPLAILSLYSYAQNVGVGTAIPAEKLDVNGNINVQGNIKINNVQGTPDQLLMTNSAGATVWADPCGYKNLATFTQSGSWVVPAGVTSIYAEALGGGGGGAAGGGGAGANYIITQKLTVVPGGSVTITVGAGGAAATTINTGGSNGGFSLINGSFGIYEALGGNGASTASGGYASAIGLNGDNYIQYPGASGNSTVYESSQRGATQFVETRKFGTGGGIYPFYNNGGPGGSLVVDLGTSLVLRTVSPPLCSVNGVGGGGGSTGTNYGSDGVKGLVIIHY